MISSLDKLKKELVKARTTNNENKRQIFIKGNLNDIQFLIIFAAFL